jgi:hypothetical protein
VRAALFLEFTAAGLAPWWISRAWKSEPPALPDEWEERWEYEVAESPKAGPLAGTVLTRDEAAGRYRLRCAPGNGGPGIAKADALACSLLSRPPGTVTISHDPEGDINDYLVAFTDRRTGPSSGTPTAPPSTTTAPSPSPTPPTGAPSASPSTPRPAPPTS